MANKSYERYGLPCTNFHRTYRWSAALSADPLTLNFTQLDKTVKSKDSNASTTLRLSTAFTETIFTKIRLDK